MIIGFGAVEVEREKQIMRECADAIIAGRVPNDVTRTIKETDNRLKQIRKRYDSECDAYKVLDRNEAPERYSTFWTSHHRIWDEKTITEFNFMHINRRHAFSPDGWAALQTKAILVVDGDDVRYFSES